MADSLVLRPVHPLVHRPAMITAAIEATAT